MRTKHYLITGMLGIAFVGMIVTGCRKDTNSSNPATVDSDATPAQDEANGTYVVNDSKNISDGSARGTATERTLGMCATWTRRDTVIGSVTDTLIDIYFTGSCVSPDGRTRKGHILVMWNGKGYFDSAAAITMTWKNYSVTTLTGTVIGVSGIRTLTNTGKDSLGDNSWSYTANLTLTYSTGGTATWVASRTNTLTKIKGIWYYMISGSGSGVSKSGVSYTVTITSPLYWTAYWLNLLMGNKICDCFEAGAETFTRSNKAYPLYLTFTSGVGNCNHTAIATINGTVYPIILP